MTVLNHLQALLLTKSRMEHFKEMALFRGLRGFAVLRFSSVNYESSVE